MSHNRLRFVEACVVALLVALLLLCASQAWANILIVDEAGELVRQCEPPVTLYPDQAAIVCKTPTRVFADGFE